MKIYCDSSTKEACIVVEGQDPIVLPYFDKVTVNVGEYRAVQKALEYALYRDFEAVQLFTDSLLVVNQASGKWRCKKFYLLPLCIHVRWLLKATGATLEWIPRGENLAGLVLG